MPYTINRHQSLVVPSTIGLNPIYVLTISSATFIQLKFLFVSYTSQFFSKGWVGYFLFVCFLIGFALLSVRWRSARAEAKRTDEEWDAFVNAGLSIRPAQAAVADPAHWLASSLPVLGESSRPAQWLESLTIPFQQPKSLTMQTPEQARHFAATYETAALGKITTQISDGVGSQGSGGLTAIGRVVLHGKPHCLVFRQATEDTMIFFLFRVEVVGTVASIMCGGTHFIRRAAATGDTARRKKLSDDDVVVACQDQISRLTVSWGMGFTGIVLAIPSIGAIFLAAILIYLLFGSPFGVEAKLSWWRRGELACWQMVDIWRTEVDWPGLQPDRTAALAELDYMVSMLQHDLLRERQAPPDSQPSRPAEPCNDNHSPPDESDGYL